MTLPAYADVDLALLVELVRAKRAVRPAEMYLPVASHFPELTEADLALTRKDGRTKVFQNIVHWARDHLRVLGLLRPNSAGLWEVNEGGVAAIVTELQKRRVSAEAAGRFIANTSHLSELLGVQWARPLRERPGRERVHAPENDRVTDTVAARQVLREAPAESVGSGEEESIRKELLARLNRMDGYEFEQLVARILDSVGLRDSQITARSGDEGVDVLSTLYSPLVTARVAVQVKRHVANVGPKDISYLRDRWVRRADKLLFITTSDFTPGAREVAAEDKEVVLVNGRQLVDLMVEHGLGVRKQPLVTYAIEEEFFSS